MSTHGDATVIADCIGAERVVVSSKDSDRRIGPRCCCRFERDRSGDVVGNSARGDVGVGHVSLSNFATGVPTCSWLPCQCACNPERGRMSDEGTSRVLSSSGSELERGIVGIFVTDCWEWSVGKKPACGTEDAAGSHCCGREDAAGKPCCKVLASLRCSASLCLYSDKFTLRRPRCPRKPRLFWAM